MAVAKDFKVHAQFSNELQLVKCVLDYSKDGGAVAAYEVLEAQEDMVIHSACLKIKEGFTSGGSATLSVGKTGDVAGLVAATAVASLTTGALIDSASFGSSYKVAAGQKVLFDIATAAMTAGKAEVVLLVSKF